MYPVTTDEKRAQEFEGNQREVCEKVQREEGEERNTIITINLKTER